MVGRARATWEPHNMSPSIKYCTKHARAWTPPHKQALTLAWPAVSMSEDGTGTLLVVISLSVSANENWRVLMTNVNF